MSDEKKYELTGETREVDGVTVYRIRALRTIRLRADAGDLGGWVSGEKNLSQNGDCWIGVNATVMEQARVQGDARVTGDALVRGNAVVSRSAHVTADAVVSGYTYVTDSAYVSGEARVLENAQLCDDATVLGRAQVQGTAALYGRSRVEGDALVAGNAELRDAHLDDGATVRGMGEVIVLSGLFPDRVTIYRAANEVGGHVVIAGCQVFSLEWDVKLLEKLAKRHDWALPAGWRSLRQALLVTVRSWQRQGQGSAQGQA